MDCYKYEEARLATFSNWSSPYVSPEELARSGFFYLQKLDHVKCFYCFGILGDWNEGDNAIEEHEGFFPFCPFIRKMNIGKIPADSFPQSFDVCGKMDLTYYETSYPERYKSFNPEQELTHEEKEENYTDESALCKVCLIKNINIIFDLCGSLTCFPCGYDLIKSYISRNLLLKE